MLSPWQAESQPLLWDSRQVFRERKRQRRRNLSRPGRRSGISSRLEPAVVPEPRARLPVRPRGRRLVRPQGRRRLPHPQGAAAAVAAAAAAVPQLGRRLPARLRTLQRRLGLPLLARVRAGAAVAFPAAAGAAVP